MAKKVVIARLCGFERVQFMKKDGSGEVSFFRTYFDYKDDAVKGVGTAQATIFTDAFSQDRLQLGDSCYIVVDGGKFDYAGRAPVPAAVAK